jgi:hypothetical protein
VEHFVEIRIISEVIEPGSLCETKQAWPLEHKRVFLHTGRQRKGWFYTRFKFELLQQHKRLQSKTMGRIKKKKAVARAKSRLFGKFQDSFSLLQKELLKLAHSIVHTLPEELDGLVFGIDLECDSRDGFDGEQQEEGEECNVEATLHDVLQWNSNAVLAIPRGDSARTVRRRKLEAEQLKQSAGKSGTILKFFIPVPAVRPTA